jgi:hypothetical protein
MILQAEQGQALSCYLVVLESRWLVYLLHDSITKQTKDTGYALAPLPDLAARGDQGGEALSTRSPPAMLVPSPSACSGDGGEGGSGLSAL